MSGSRSEARSLEQALALLAQEDCWLVGGAVRDELLGEASADLDVAVAGDPERPAQRLSRALRAPVFPLSAEFGAWRVSGDGWQIDLSPLQGATIEQDLARRDLTINAIARRPGGGEPVDPYGGRDDLARGLVRMVSESAFDEDPLRTLRVARIACELGFEVDRATMAAARARAPLAGAVAQERVFVELRRLIAAERVRDGLRLLDELALTEHVLPELARLRGVEQNRYHHLDAFEHTLLVLDKVVELQENPGTLLGCCPEDVVAAVADLLGEGLADGASRGTALRFGALLHDVAKPDTQATSEDGTVLGFPHHAEVGAEQVRALLTRLRVSDRLRSHVAALTRHHLGLGFLVHADPLDRRTIHRYLTTTAPVHVDVSLLSIADRLATGGHKAESSIARHMAVAAAVLPLALAFAAEQQRAPLVRGELLIGELGIEPGPLVGELLAEVAAARYAGEIDSAEQALDHARRLLTARSAPDGQ